MTRRKYLIFCPPFKGHTNVLTAMTRLYGAEVDFKIVVTGWDNIPVPHEIGPHTSLNAPALYQTDPALWTLPRVLQLIPECLRIAKEERPDVIIYDFFSIEGHIVGKILGIPTWCSIPAFVGPFDRKYLLRKLDDPENADALQAIRQFSGLPLTLDEFEMVSDGLHLPGDIDLVWSYPSITPGPASARRVFVGNPLSAPEPARSERTAACLFLIWNGCHG